MKGKEKTIRELQEEINKRLEQFSGKKYEGTQYHSWYHNEISRVLLENRITEIHPITCSIVLDATEQGISTFRKEIAKVNIEARKDKRFKYGGGRGVIFSISAEFREDLLPLSLNKARRVLLEETRSEYIKNIEAIRDNARAELEKAEQDIARLASVRF